MCHEIQSPQQQRAVGHPRQWTQLLFGHTLRFCTATLCCCASRDFCSCFCCLAVFCIWCRVSCFQLLTHLWWKISRVLHLLLILSMNRDYKLLMQCRRSCEINVANIFSLLLLKLFKRVCVWLTGEWREQTAFFFYYYYYSLFSVKSLNFQPFLFRPKTQSIIFDHYELKIFVGRNFSASLVFGLNIVLGKTFNLV